MKMKPMSSKVKKILCRIGTGFAIPLSILSTLLCFSIVWMFNTWSNLTIDELVYHLTAPLEGTNQSMITDYVNSCVFPAIFVFFLVLVLFSGLRKSPRLYLIVLLTGLILPVLSSAGFLYYAWSNLDVGSYVKGQSSYSTFIDDNYIDPAQTEMVFPEQKRNLIYIFLESMETTYASQEIGGAFSDNMIPELTELANDNENFSGDNINLNGGYAMPGSTWTIGGMFSQSSGLPLSISIDSNSMDTQSTFFAGATTLGDILKQEGYNQSLIVGSDAVFGGRELYYREHGDYNIMDYNSALRDKWLPNDYRVWWGFEDEKLFQFAQNQLNELSQKSEPFNLTLLTVDTHFEDGYLCENCPKEYGDDQYANVIACSSRQVADFVSWAQTQDFYENTTIVISGDHPTMDSDFCDDIDSDYTRKVYTAYINPAAENLSEGMREYTTLDNFPTTLSSMGVQIEGDRLGLGTDLFSGKPTLYERFGKSKMKSELSRKSQLMETLADLDEGTTNLLIREGKLPAAVPTSIVTTGEYNRDTATFPVHASSPENAPDGTESLLAAVWSTEDQSDVQWMPMELQEDGSYLVNVDVTLFDYRTGNYTIHVYLTDSRGEMFFISESVVPVS